MKQEEIDRQFNLLVTFLGSNKLTNRPFKLYVGIDPGVTGAIGFVFVSRVNRKTKGQLIGMAIDIPTTDPPKTKKRQLKTKKRRKHKRPEFDLENIRRIFSLLRCPGNALAWTPLVYLEKGQTFGNVQRFTAFQNNNSGGTFKRETPMTAYRVGWATGMWPLYFREIDLHYEMKAPNSWKKKMDLTSDKEECRAYARQLFPMVELNRKKDHNRAEALLLAYHAYLVNNQPESSQSK